MSVSNSPTLLAPADRDDSSAPEDDARASTAYLRKRREGSSGGGTTALPTDLQNQATARLRILALLYAFTFFMAAFFPALLFDETRQMLASSPLHWLPGGLSIATGLLVAWFVRDGSLRGTAIAALIPAFEIASSYGIAAAEFIHPAGLTFSNTWIGLSWVAPWVLLFNVVVPTVPRRAVLAALASVTAVPVMVLVSLASFGPSRDPRVDALGVFFTFVFPYLLVVIMAYVGARVVYNLGRQVTHARELGSYRLVQRLGAGGMGEVWRADHRLLARPAAIKLIRTAAPGSVRADVSEGQRRRFEREAQVIAQLRSPHTVTLFDFGVADDGAFYYAMELLDGLDADRLVKRFGPMPAERVVWILKQMCHSLSEAESCGLVHRDIKPANVFLCRYGEDHDFVKVVDFGIAKATAASTPAISLTVANAVHGTPAFMAPEQALGVEIDSRADIYSTGCVAYWLLTGELVFVGETPMKVVLAHAQQTPVPPSARAELPVPRELDALVMACLAKAREDRPASARDLLARLEAVRLETPWTAARARDWWHLHLPPQ